MKKLRAKFLSRQVTSLLASTKGNVAITFALATMPLILAVGATVDYTGANKIKARLDAAADAAALAAVSKGTMPLSTAQAKTEAEGFFKVQAPKAEVAEITSAKATVTQTSNARTAVFDYTANYRTSFMGIAGYDTVQLKGSATATSATLVYADFHLLLDNSPSMGIAATPKDVATMEKAFGCAFACHDSTSSPDTYTRAMSLGVQTRIDTVRAAAKNLTATATSTQTVSGQIRMGVYSFGQTADDVGLTVVAPLSASLATVADKTNALNLMWTKNGDHTPLTYFDDIFVDMNAKIPNPGDGTSPSSPQQYLIFVSDGLGDKKSTTCDGPLAAGKRCLEALKTSNCDVIKKRGIKIAVLYTTYLPLADPTYIGFIASMNAGPWGPSPNSTIAKRMQACASPGLFFEVSPTDGISDAMKALFLQMAKMAHITK